MDLIDAVPVEWRKHIKQSAHCGHPELTNTVHLKIDNTDVNLSFVTLQGIQNGEQTPPSAQKSFRINFLMSNLIGTKFICSHFKVSLETKIREF